MRECKICGAKFAPATQNQLYCSWSCKRKAERQRAQARRRPTATQPTAESRVFVVLTAPSVELLTQLRAANQTGKPIQVEQAAPEVLAAFPDMGQPLGESYHLLF
jgi:hypothetical protein